MDVREDESPSLPLSGCFGVQRLLVPHPHDLIEMQGLLGLEHKGEKARGLTIPLAKLSREA